MRSAIIALVIFCFAAQPNASYAQLRKIPAVVTDAFKFKYRNAESIEWKDKLSHYVVYFQLNGDRYDATFKNDGSWVFSQRVIAEDELPDAVEEGLSKSKYADWDIDSYFELVYPDERTEYRLLARKSDLNKRDLLFTTKGRLIKDKLTL